MTGKTASYERRADDWRLQANLAAHELMQMGRQIISSLIAEQVAEHEYESAKTQVANSQEVDQRLRSKFTNAELYGWMQGEIARIYYKFYRFAFDIARKAERTMKRELMRPELDATDFIQFNYWDTGRKGLLSGEALFLDLKRMEMAYHDNNKRELELTRHVSLRQLDPHALLHAADDRGPARSTIPEWLYDLDCPGLYMRRIKTMALSLPSVGRALHERQLHVDAAAQHHSRFVARRQRLYAGHRQPRRSLRRLSRLDRRDRHQRRRTTTRHVRDEPARRAVPAV